jgi:RNA polymerase subunit RPABC4/transcription elongation factor Spt4
MALVPCPECHKEVSTEAWACPQCAFPFPGKPVIHEERPAVRLATCSRCHGSIPQHAKDCPQCGMSISVEQEGRQEPREAPGQKTQPDPHSRLSYTRKTPQTGAASTVLKGPAPAIPAENMPSPPQSRSVDPSRHDRTLESPRKRAPLWQDPAWQSPLRPQKPSSLRYPRSSRHSIIVGIILLVIVAISVMFGAIWQLNGLNPLEAILSWRM